MLESKAKIFRYFLLCFIAGIAIRSFFAVELFYLYISVLVLVTLLILFWQTKWRWLFLGGIVIVLGILRYQLSLPQTDETKIWFYNGQRVNFEGVVVKEADTRINHTKLTVEVRRLTVNGQRLTVNSKVLISVSLYPKYHYGDLIAVNCQLKSPEPFNDFAYDRYLAKSKIYSQCSYPRVKLISSGHGDWLLTKIFKFKDKLKSIINSNLPEPQVSLFSAITLGVRRGVPQELSDKFSITGTSHLIAISGLHITIITVILMKIALTCYLPRKKAFWLITTILASYVVMIGFPPSAVRASLMGWLAMLAMYVGRLNRSTNALIFVGSLMILINPKILRDDIGFQLSFCAVLGLIYFSPLFEKWLEKMPSYLGIKESLQMTLSAQITTLPIIVYNFGRISLVGPIVNLLVLPILPYLMIVGFAALFLSLLLSGIAQYLFWPVWVLLTYLIKVIEIMASIPGAAISL